MIKKITIITFSCIIFLLISVGLSVPASASPESPSLSDANQGAELFNFHCAGCHPGGGNIIRRGKTLQLKALKRHGMDSEVAITELVNNGKGNMSAFKDRLTVPEIQQVVTYVLTQAQQGWQ